VIFQCEHCLRILKTQKGLDSHLDRFKREGTCKFVCKFCGEVFNTRSMLSKHRSNRRMHGYCGKKKIVKQVYRRPKRISLKEIENHWT
jgi:hypothetical protein